MENEDSHSLKVNKLGNDKSQSLIISPKLSKSSVTAKPMPNENLDQPKYQANNHFRNSLQKNFDPIIIDEPDSIE